MKRVLCVGGKMKNSSVELAPGKRHVVKLLISHSTYAMLQGTLKSSRIKNSTIPRRYENKLFQIDFRLDGRENILIIIYPVEQTEVDKRLPKS